MDYNNLTEVINKAVSMTKQEVDDLLGEEGLRLVKIIEHGDNYIFCECKKKKYPWERVELLIDSDRNVTIAPT